MSLAPASFHSWLFSPSPAPPAIAIPSGRPRSPSWWWPRSRSRSISRSPARWAPWWSAIYAATGLIYATTLLAAEWHYTAASRASSPAAALARLERAASWFSLAARYRAAPSYFHSAYRWPGSRIPGMVTIAAELDRDPYALDLRLNLAALLIEGGHLDPAFREVALVHALSPKSRIRIGVHAP